MAVTIADLEVNIRDNGQSATLALNALINTLSKLASNIEPASKALKETTKELKTVDKTASSAARGGLGKFFKSIVRIAGYRAIRSALKAITSSFREGVQNIALYSQAIGGVDASKANEVMSAYASMGAQIKNSLGAAVMPLLANLLPVIQKVADMFMDAAEAVAQFFAALNGQTTYTAANRDYWVDYAAGLDKSNKAAKELKRTILGFDEINALNSQSSGSSGSTTNYKDMFVEKDNPLSYENAKKILDVIKLIGIGLAAWKISSSVVNALTALSTMSSLKTFTIGLVLSITGIALSYNGGLNVGLGNYGLGATEGIGGVLASALGGFLMGATLGHPIIGLTLGLFASIISFEIGSMYGAAKKRAREYIAQMLDGTGLTIDDFSDDAIQAHMDLATEIRNKITNIKSIANPQALKDLKAASDLVEKIFSLDGIEIKTPEQMAELNMLVEVFNGYNLDGIQLEFDDTTGKIKQSKEEIYNSISALEELIKKEAAMEAAKESYKQLIIAQEELNTLYAQRKVYLDSIAKAIEEGDFGAMSQLLGDLRDIDSAIHTQESNVKQLDAAWRSFLRQATGATDDWNTAVKGVGTTISGLLFPNYSNGRWSLSRPELKASGGFVPSGDLFVAGEAGAELIMSAPGGSEVVNMAQFQDAMVSAVMMAGGNGGGDITIIVQDGNGNERSRQVITAAERANRRDGRTIIPVGVY